MSFDLKSVIGNIRKSHEAKTLLSNFSWLAALQIITYLFPMITMPYLAKVIGVSGFGKIAFAAAVMVWIQTITDWGFNTTAARDIARVKDNIDQLSKIYCNVQYSRLLMMLLSLFLLVILILIIPKFGESKTILLVTFLMVPGHIAFPTWFFQGVERMKYSTILNIVARTIFTFSIFIFIKEKEDYILQPLLNSIGFICSGVIAQIIIFKNWGVKLFRPSFAEIKTTIAASYDVFINTIMPNLYNSFSIMLLGFFGGPFSNGLLDAGRKFVAIGHSIVEIITQAFYPFLSRRIEKHSVYVNISMILSSAMALVLFLGAPVFIHVFFTQEFYGAIPLMRICSLGIIPIALNRAYGTGYMILQGHERKLRNITIFVSVCGFIFAFPLIYFFDYYGAAINITLSQVLLGVSVTFCGLKIKNIKNQK